VVSDGTTSYVRDGSGAILSETTAAGTQIPLSDGLGSIRRLVDPGGTSGGTAAYDVFGARLSGTGSVGAFGFAGEAADPTGLIFLRARHYNPSWGRFMSADVAAIGASGTVGANRYVYTGDDPVNRTDPTGRFAVELAIEEDEETAVADAALPPASKAIYYVIAIVILALLGIAATGCFYFHAWVCHALQNPPRPGDNPHPGPGAKTFAPDAQTDALQKQAATQQAAEQSKADECEATDPLAPVNDPSSPCRAPGLKIFFPGGDTPATTLHDLTAIAGYALWGYLVKTPGIGEKYRNWYDSPTYHAQDASNPCFQRSKGTVCDEYPFFKTIYGGPFNNPQPSLAVTSKNESDKQGGYISSFYRDSKCGLVDYDVIRGGFFVIPAPLAPKTFWICNP
jgi:RHS repeat-associated protein